MKEKNILHYMKYFTIKLKKNMMKKLSEEQITNLIKLAKRTTTQDSVWRMKKLLFILLISSLGACQSYTEEYAIVSRVEITGYDKNKYRVYLNFRPIQQKLITNTPYVPGDTLYFCKR
jgi:hypothetical protein